MPSLLFQGVIEYSLTLFFAKLVSYTFLFWLPLYIRDAGGFDPSASADLSAVFDLGGIIGGIIAGYVSDTTGASAITCVVLLILSIPTVSEISGVIMMISITVTNLFTPLKLAP
ncbi:unnamed protein product [Trichobilharzia regenti]|nr:unnamed protein product [Trichobilharzia regenti]